MAHPHVEQGGDGQAIAMAVHSLMRAGRHMQAAMGRRLSLGETDLNAMDELARAGEPIGPVELGNRLGIRSASATMLVDRLEAAGHVHRERHPRDRRRITLHPTSAALEEVRSVLAPIIGSVNEIAAALSDEQARVVLKFLQDLTGAMDRYAHEDPVGPGRAQAGQ